MDNLADIFKEVGFQYYEEIQDEPLETLAKDPDMFAQAFLTALEATDKLTDDDLVSMNELIIDEDYYKAAVMLFPLMRDCFLRWADDNSSLVYTNEE